MNQAANKSYRLKLNKDVVYKDWACLKILELENVKC